MPAFVWFSQSHYILFVVKNELKRLLTSPYVGWHGGKIVSSPTQIFGCPVHLNIDLLVAVVVGLCIDVCAGGVSTSADVPKRLKINVDIDRIKFSGPCSGTLVSVELPVIDSLDECKLSMVKRSKSSCDRISFALWNWAAFECSYSFCRFSSSWLCSKFTWYTFS